MANFELVMPKLGESIEEATITKWIVKAGDKVKDDDILLEIATDKVDSEIPSPVSGTVIKILYQQDETVAVGTVIAVIDTSGADFQPEKAETNVIEPELKETPEPKAEEVLPDDTGRYYSPLVRKIASEENVSLAELGGITGSGRNERVRKEDLLKYLEQRGKREPVKESIKGSVVGKESSVTVSKPSPEKPKITANPGDEIIKMDRVRKLIAEHMVMSKSVSAHVTNMIETDVTNIVLWRNRIKEEFYNREKEKITYLPVFLEFVISALKDYPLINSSVDGD
jgi:2-oxoglutarate dehydrogenase E2 component (dihydrolipoamide succinyltransferase)